jgi:hypothetical protein
MVELRGGVAEGLNNPTPQEKRCWLNFSKPGWTYEVEEVEKQL